MKYHFFHFMLQAPLLHEFLTCLRSPQWNVLYHVACQRCQHSRFWGWASAWELKAWCRDEGGSGRYWHPSRRVRTSAPWPWSTGSLHTLLFESRAPDTEIWIFLCMGRALAILLWYIVYFLFWNNTHSARRVLQETSFLRLFLLF